jgi:hypothetical protein
MDKEKEQSDRFPISKEAAEKLYPVFDKMDKDTTNDEEIVEKHRFSTELIRRSEMLGAVFIELSRGIAIIRWVELENIRAWRWEFGENCEYSRTFTEALNDVCDYIDKRNEEMKRCMWISAWRKEASGR